MNNKRYVSILFIAVMLFCFFSARFVSASNSEADNSLADWYAFTPYDDFRDCSNWGKQEWHVSLDGNNVLVHELPRPRKQQPFPFPFEMGNASEGLAGDVAIHKVINGYLLVLTPVSLVVAYGGSPVMEKNVNTWLKIIYCPFTRSISA